MLAGAGANLTVQIGDDGVLLVDTGSAATSDKVLAAIRTLTDKPIRWIINTQVDADHTGANAAIARAGRSIPQIAVGVGKLFSDAEQVATIVAHENVQKRMSAPTGQLAPAPVDAWPTATFFTREKEMFFNGEPIVIVHEPAAHTDGDVVVFFRRSDVVASGDIFITTGYPVIDVARGGTIDGFIDAINDVIHITIPQEKQEGGTYVVPGHGRLSDEADVVDVRDMATIVRDRVQAMIKAGMTLEAVQAARPTLEYDGRYSTAAWTGPMFIEAVYRTLTAAPSRTSDVRENATPVVSRGN
jgi:glyoxylase-like metal-dependent hydrolase (beta-lactamase superfamily II)